MVLDSPSDSDSDTSMLSISDDDDEKVCRPVHDIDDNSSSSSDIPLIKLILKKEDGLLVASDSTKSPDLSASPIKSSTNLNTEQVNKATTPSGNKSGKDTLSSSEDEKELSNPEDSSDVPLGKLVMKQKQLPEEDESSSDVPLSKLACPIKKNQVPEDDSSSDVPLSKLVMKQKQLPEEDESSSDVPLSKLACPIKKNQVPEDDSNSDVPLSKLDSKKNKLVASGSSKKNVTETETTSKKTKNKKSPVKKTKKKDTPKPAKKILQDSSDEGDSDSSADTAVLSNKFKSPAVKVKTVAVINEDNSSSDALPLSKLGDKKQKALPSSSVGSSKEKIKKDTPAKGTKSLKSETSSKKKTLKSKPSSKLEDDSDEETPKKSTKKFVPDIPSSDDDSTCSLPSSSTAAAKKINTVEVIDESSNDTPLINLLPKEAKANLKRKRSNASAVSNQPSKTKKMENDLHSEAEDSENDKTLTKEPQADSSSSDSDSSSSSVKENKSVKDNKITVSAKKNLSNIDIIKTLEDSSAMSGISDSDSSDEGEEEPTKAKTENRHSSSSSSDAESIVEKNSEKKKKSQGIGKKDKSSEKGKKSGLSKPEVDKQIARMQVFLREAGIRVKSYDKLWEGCKTTKAKIESLLNLLRERGLKGKPTVTECRRLKEKFERKQEVAELDTSNIITTTGRGRRSAASASKSRHATGPEKSPDFKRPFKRLKGIVDDEESD